MLYRRSTPSIAVLVLFLVVGCGGSFVHKANKTLVASLAVPNAARDGFVSWDRAHQLELVDSSATKAEAVARLKTYRAKRAKVLKAFTVAYVSIDIAVALMPLVDKGLKKETDLLPLLADVAVAVAAVKDAYDTLKER